MLLVFFSWRPHWAPSSRSSANTTSEMQLREELRDVQKGATRVHHQDSSAKTPGGVIHHRYHAKVHASNDGSLVPERCLW